MRCHQAVALPFRLSKRYRKPYLLYLQQNAAAADAFHQGMANVSSMLAYAILMAYDFAGIAFLSIQSAFQIEMAIVNIAIQNNLANALALVARGMKGLLLGEPIRGSCGSDTEDPRMVHWSPPNSCEALVSLGCCVASSSAAS